MLEEARLDMKPFNILTYLCTTLGLQNSVVLQSDVSLLLQIINIKEIFLELRRLSLECLILYESDLL